MVADTSLLEPAGASTPGSPGTPQQGTPFFEEDFSNQNAAAAPIGITAYAGGTAQQNETYTADPGWRETAQQCNGWILQQTPPRPTPAQDASCQTTSGSDDRNDSTKPPSANAMIGHPRATASVIMVARQIVLTISAYVAS